MYTSFSCDLKSLREDISPSLKPLFDHPIRLLDKYYVEKVSLEMNEYHLYRLSIGLHLNNQYKDLTTVLFLVVVMKVYSGNLNSIQKYLVEEYKKVENVKIDALSLINGYSTEIKSEEELESWEELKAMSNTLRECSILTHSSETEFITNIAPQFRNFVDGMIHLFKAQYSTERATHLQKAYVCLLFSSAVVLEEDISSSFWFYLPDFIKIIPPEKLEVFVSSLLLDVRHMDIETITCMLTNERARCLEKCFKERTLEISRILEEIELALAQPQELSKIIEINKREPLKFNLLHVSVHVRKSNYNDEEIFWAIHKISNPLNDFRPVYDKIPVLLFHCVRLINRLLANRQSIYRISQFLNRALHDSFSFVKDHEHIRIILQVFIGHVESLLVSIPDLDTRYCLAELMVGMYGLLCKISPSNKHYQERKEKFLKAFNSIALEYFPCDDEE